MIPSKHFKLAAVLPFSIAACIGIILIVSHDGSKYKSEWFTNDGFAETVLLMILVSAFISILSLTIFLNSFSSIKNNPIILLVTSLALPSFLCAFIMYQEVLNFMGKSNIDGVYHGSRLVDSYMISIATIHLVALFTSYLYFRLSQKKCCQTALPVRFNKAQSSSSLELSDATEA
jgi:uncharacterized membrane protein